jgi:hypothetical protein
VLAIGLSTAAQAADDTCKVLFDADRKMILTAHHGYQTQTSLTRKDPETSESIYSGGLNGPVYIMVNGQWHRSPMSPDASLKQKEENIRNSKSSCRYLRDEAVNSESAAVYSVHAETEDSKSDGTVWVGKRNGLPLREEMGLDLSPGKMHYTVRYDYSNVHVPDGVSD